VLELEAEMEALKCLVGEWSGGGRGDFPTIDAFRYTETTRFYWNGVEPMLQFEQRTWVLGDLDAPLHWETGFFRALPSLTVELTNAQNGERVEVMRGRIDPGPNAMVLTLDSTILENDDRLLRTRRRYECENDTLRYQVWMATRKTPELTPHLEARLTRSRVIDEAPG
jgi:hypothetical protein